MPLPTTCWQDLNIVTEWVDGAEGEDNQCFGFPHWNATRGISRADNLTYYYGARDIKRERLKGRDHESKKTTPALPPPQLVLHRPDEAHNPSTFLLLFLYDRLHPLRVLLFSHLLSLLVNSASPLLRTAVCSSISLQLTLDSCCTYLFRCFALAIPISKNSDLLWMWPANEMRIHSLLVRPLSQDGHVLSGLVKRFGIVLSFAVCSMFSQCQNISPFLYVLQPRLRMMHLSAHGCAK